ncbi:hypothetical protein [Flavobacterium haoranii]|uniref:Uncharacterized protein n=1 Tax=Flavobacterium haoranii TaxID=683124 RepID=A0A1M6BNH6_9FLAO|nr:hypothetical protein [Flavobacterium haoranii]MDK2771195.1 hypothetical protein [Flavobacterium sp.]SHI50311.1 hypothetical protein SAMN05444337_0159 [Flavobacterium haoranii]
MKNINWKKLLFTNWHIMRFVRLVLAMGISLHAYKSGESFFYLFALYFLIQTIFDFGCHQGSCSIKK